MPALMMVGGGKMGEALLGGLLAQNWALPADLTVVEPHEPRRLDLAERHPGVLTVADVTEGPLRTDVLIAVKPDVVASVCARLAEAPRVLSIAAGVTTASLEDWLPRGTPVVRAMPNTPSLVGAGAAAIAPGSTATDADLAWASSILGAVGTVVTCEESQMDVVTGLSGSGPAYVFLLAEALTAAAIGLGLPPEVADVLTRQMIRGAGELLATSDEDPARLRADVTSPGGTTAAGLSVFEQAGFHDLVHRVVAAAAARSAELGSTSVSPS